MGDFTLVSRPDGNAAHYLDGSGTYSSPPAPAQPATLPIGADKEMWVQDFSGGSVTGAGSSNLADTSDVLLGAQSATMTTAGDGATFANLSLTSLTKKNLVGKQLLLWVKVDDPLHLSSLKVILGNGGFANTYNLPIQLASTASTTGLQLVQAGVWQPVTLNFQDATAVGSPNRTNIDSIRLQAKDTGQAITVKIAGIALFDEPVAAFPGGVVSLCFDDGYSTQYSKVRPYLDNYGMVATALPIAAQIGTGGTYMTLAQLQELQDKHGWEVAAHSYAQATHDARFTGISTGDLAADIEKNKEWLTDNGFRGGDLTAYPGGIYSDSVKQTVRQYFSFARGVISNTHETFPPGDPFVVRAYPCDNSTGGPSLANIEAAVDAAAANHGWLILVLHDIQDAAAANTIQWSTANFQALIDYIAAKKIPVRTVGDVLRERRPTKTAAAVAAPSPRSHKLVGWTFDPATSDQVGALGKGIVYGCRIPTPDDTLVTGLKMYVSSAGVTLSNCYAILYDAAGNQLAVSADVSTTLQSTGEATLPFSSSVWARGGPAQAVYAAILIGNGSTTPPTVMRARTVGSASINLGVTAADGLRSCQSGTSLTAAPSTIDLTAATAQGNLWWMGLY